MLLMGSKALTVEGITVFPDHADPAQFWYLPAPVALATRNGTPQFTLIRYRPAVADSGMRGGGFLTLEVNLKLDPEVERKIRTAVSRISTGTPRLSAVPFDQGTVQVVALNIQGGGGTNAQPAPPGAFVAVESVLGATHPSLGGDNNAVFSLTLSQEGSVILDQAFREGAMPVGVIYDLKYTALRPALDVKITANFKRIYDHLSFSVDLTAGAVIYGVPVYLEAGIDMAFEKLKQDGVITVEVINFSDANDEANKEKWALDFFKESLLAQWFAPTLPPVTFDRRSNNTSPIPGVGSLPGVGSIPGLGGGGGGTTGTTGTPGTSSGGGTTGTSGTSSGGGKTSSGGTATGGTTSGTPTGGTSSGGTSSGGTSSGGTSSGGTSSGGTSSGGTSSGGTSSGGTSSGGTSSGGTATGGSSSSGGNGAPRPGGGSAGHESVPMGRVVREVWAYPFLETGRQPAQLDKRIVPQTPGYDIQLSQPQDSDRVTLTFLGGDVPPTVRINTVAETLSGRQLTRDLPAGTSLQVEADYPAGPGTTQEFRLMFDFDLPSRQGWSTSPPSQSYTGYLQNSTNPYDSAFQGSGAPGGTGLGADALRAWLQSALGSPRRVTVNAHASYEGDDRTAVHNQELSQRRLEAALGIIGSSAQVTTSNAHGFSVARAASRSSDPADRCAIVQGASAGGSPVTIRGTLSRASAPAGTGTTTPGGTATPGTGTPGTGTPGTGTPGTGTPTTGTGGGTGTTPTGGGKTGTPATTTPTTGSTPAGGGGVPGTPPMGVKLAFRLKKIEQVEDKNVTLFYNRQSSVQRSYSPQGLIGLLADDLDGPPHFIEVDLDSPFFRTLDIELEAPPAFEPIGLLKADVAIEYGQKTDPGGVKHRDVTFRPTGQKLEKATFFLNPGRDLGYQCKLQYHFDPLSGWDGEQLSYDLPAETLLDRTLLLNPFRHFGFLQVRVVAGDIDAAMIDSTDVHLRYEHEGRWSRDKVITVRPGVAEQSWKLRLSDPTKRAFSYRLVHRLKDGTTRETAPVSTTVPVVTVNDPFEEPLIVEFFPNYDPTKIELLIVDVTFEDPELRLKREQRLELRGELPTPQRLRFARSSSAVKRFSFQITILGHDRSVRRMPAVSSQSTVIFIGEHMGLESSPRRSKNEQFEQREHQQQPGR